jgi:DNA polymerase III subunit beta
MKVKVSKNSLLMALQKVDSIVGTRSTLQILSNVFIQAIDNKLILVTTDLDIRIKKEISAEVIESGETTIPVKKFFEIARELLGDEVYLETEQNHMTIKNGNANFKLLGLPVDDFPVPDKSSVIRSFTINQNELSRVLNLISYAVKQDETRKSLNGILLSTSENNITSVATDGRRLALVERSLENFTGTDGNVIIPIKSAKELGKLLGKTGSVRIEISTNLVNFIMDDATVMTTKVIDENYPNYRQVIPVAFSKNISVKKENFLSILRRVSTVVSERSSFIKAVFSKNKLEMSAASTEFGESCDFIEMEYDGPEIIISFNPTFLREPLEHIDSDDISIKMNDGYSPVALSNEDGFLYIVMPMRNK